MSGRSIRSNAGTATFVSRRTVVLFERIKPTVVIHLAAAQKVESAGEGESSGERLDRRSNDGDAGHGFTEGRAETVPAPASTASAVRSRIHFHARRRHSGTVRRAVHIVPRMRRVQPRFCSPPVSGMDCLRSGGPANMYGPGGNSIEPKQRQWPRRFANASEAPGQGG